LTGHVNYIVQADLTVWPHTSRWIYCLLWQSRKRLKSTRWHDCCHWQDATCMAFQFRIRWIISALKIINDRNISTSQFSRGTFTTLPTPLTTISFQTSNCGEGVTAGRS
jgi:hypothetical protein